MIGCVDSLASPRPRSTYFNTVVRFENLIFRMYFKEKVSGAKTDRPELAKAIGRLEPGDVVVVTRLDRLARSTRDLLNVIAAIADRGAGFKSLKDAWADTD